MDKIITLTVSVNRPSEDCEDAIAKFAKELSQEFVEIYGGTVQVAYSAKK